MVVLSDSLADACVKGVNMKKVLLQFSVLAASFFCVWFLLSRIDFVRHFHVEQITKDNEKKLGELVLEDVRRENRELEIGQRSIVRQ